MSPAHPERTVPLTAYAVAGATVVAFVASLWLDLVTPAGQRGATGLGLERGSLSSLVGPVLAALSLPVLARRRTDRIGWILLGFGLFWAFDGLCESYVAYGVRGDEVVVPGVAFALWFVGRVGSFLLVGLALLLLLYPTGRWLPGWLGVAGRIAVLVPSLWALSVVVAPPDPAIVTDPPPGLDLGPTSLPLDPATFRPVVSALGIASLVCVVVPLVTVFVRHRRARGLDRDRMRWLLWAAVGDVLLVALGLALDAGGLLGYLVFTGVILLPAFGVTVGLVRPQLVSIDDLLARTLVYGVLALVVVLGDLAFLAGLTALLGDSLDQRQVLVVVLLITAAVYAPLRQRLWQWVRRPILGTRDTPYDVVSALASSLERADDVAEQLPTIASAVARAFGVGYVGVEIERSGRDRLVASHGERPAEVRTLPITYRGEETGRLVLPARGARARLTQRDEALLGDLVRQAAVAARSTQLADELQASREQLVLAREEERRRIRRDLHDGLGPALGGVVFRLDAARLTARSDPDATDASLGVARTQVSEVIADVRRLVHDLRPPALDDLGLVGALEQQARLATGGGPTAYAVESHGVEHLPAAVEVAAYRITSEAMTNVAKHAEAQHCQVRLEVLDAEFRIQVEDDGRGVSPEAVAGVGLTSLRERAAELGGTSEITCPEGGGTIVRARLPLRTS